MLNCIIRLQAVVKIITNKTARTLNLLTKQSIKMHNAISQINGFFFLKKKGCKRDHRQNEKACPSPHPDLERMRSQ
jgi:hypothetical protein